MTDQKLFCDAYFDLKETKNDQSKGDHVNATLILDHSDTEKVYH